MLLVHQLRRISQGKLAIGMRGLAVDSKNIHFHGPLHTNRRGIDVIHDPIWNKDLAFENHERDRLALRGLLPPAVHTMDMQLSRTLRELHAEPDDIHKNLFLQDLQNRNETLFHRLLADNVEEIAPLVYTPTVGMVCQQFGFRYNRARGMYLSIHDQGLLNAIVHNWPHHDVHVIVVTDGSRILGLGDLGAQGMGIPIGKLALYVACGGVAPHRVLPIVLDVGTNNEDLLSDPDYVGLKQHRIHGKQYFHFLDEFMEAVTERWPNVTVQFEDFETTKALPLLTRYRTRYRCFNDDIQGTGAVTLAGLYAASRHALDTAITEHRFLCAGAGTGGIGVCEQVILALVEAGLTREEAQKRFVLCSSKGALGRPDKHYGNPNHNRGLSAERLQWINEDFSDGTPIEHVIDQFKPTVFLGLTGHAGTFSESMLRQVAKHVPHPIIMPMSNPTTNSECTAEQAYHWTEGRAIVATGSPFPPTIMPDNGRVLETSQCNNMYIFPGIGLAASIGGMKRITDQMFIAAAHACSRAVDDEEMSKGMCFPRIHRIREVSHLVACAVLREGLKANLVTNFKEDDLHDLGLEAFVDKKMYFPYYVPLI